jgi:hypothetical protein
MKITAWLVVVLLVTASCGNDVDTGNDLSKKERAFLRKLHILDKDEVVILFDSQAGVFNAVEQAGNFFTDKRIVSYWIDEHDSSKTTVDYAFYADIDTIRRYPKYKSLTLSSYLEVHRRNGTKFNVYVSADSAGTWKFFNRALEEWTKVRN